MAKNFTPKLSPRLEGIVSLVPKGLKVADVGCDHGYISIALLQRGIAISSVASDIKEGPLEQAKKNIEKAHLEDKIQTRLCPGINGLKCDEADVIVIAGMGQRTIAEILLSDMETVKKVKYLVLQPQSEIPEMREFIRDNGFHLVKNIMIREGEKFYFAMLVAANEELAAAALGSNRSISDKIISNFKQPEVADYAGELDILFGLDLICFDSEFKHYLMHVDKEWSDAAEKIRNAKKPDFDKERELTKKAESAKIALEMNNMFCKGV